LTASSSDPRPEPRSASRAPPKALVKKAIEQGKEKAGQFRIGAGFDYGVDVVDPWPRCETVRVDGAPKGAHIIPEE
jgi:hypothetical protein